MNVQKSTREECIGAASFFLLGAAIGGAVALLFAPLPGREMRGKIRGGIRTGEDKLKERAELVSRRSRDLASGVVHRAENIVGTAKDAIAKQGDRIGAAVAAGQDAYRRSLDEKAV